MSRLCEFTGKGPMSGNNVSHANNKTKRRFLPNLNNVTLQSEALGRGFKFRISAAALRSVDHRGGLDAFLVKAKDSELSSNALKLKKTSKDQLKPAHNKLFAWNDGIRKPDAFVGFCLFFRQHIAFENISINGLPHFKLGMHMACNL